MLFLELQGLAYNKQSTTNSPKKQNLSSTSLNANQHYSTVKEKKRSRDQN